LSPSVATIDQNLLTNLANKIELIKFAISAFPTSFDYCILKIKKLLLFYFFLCFKNTFLMPKPQAKDCCKLGGKMYFYNLYLNFSSLKLIT